MNKVNTDEDAGLSAASVPGAATAAKAAENKRSGSKKAAVAPVAAIPLFVSW